MPPRHRLSSEDGAVSSDADQEPGRSDARTSQVPTSHDRRRHGGVRGLEVSPRGFRQDHFIQREVRHRAAQPGVLGLKLLQALDLVALQTTIFRAPAIIGYFRNPSHGEIVVKLVILRQQSWRAKGFVIAETSAVALAPAKLVGVAQPGQARMQCSVRHGYVSLAFLRTADT
jgi:hypothetical protein